MQLNELSNSCSILGHKWELAALVQANPCQTVIMEGEKQGEETANDVSACLN